MSALAIQADPGAESADPATTPDTTLIESIVQATVGLKIKVDPHARSGKELGFDRYGSAVVVDWAGHLLTSVHLVLEAESIEAITQKGFASPAHLVAYDFESGIAVLKAERFLPAGPLPLGDGDAVKAQDNVIAVAQAPNEQLVVISKVIAKRAYHAPFEYAIDDALFTLPPLLHWDGAALVNRSGELIGIGAFLMLPQQRVVRRSTDRKPVLQAATNVFIGVDEFRTALKEIIEHGERAQPDRPWLGLTAMEGAGRCTITGVLPGSPSARAGLAPGDVIIKVGGKVVATLPDLYDAIWSSGRAGARLELTVRRGNDRRVVQVDSMEQGAYFHEEHDREDDSR